MTSGRPAISLDGVWELIPDRERRLAPDRLAGGVAVEVPGPWEASLAQPYGVVHAWYRRRFTIPADWAAGDLLLQFGAVASEACAWLDGKEVGRSADPYLPFELEAGPAAAGQEHDLVVSVTNPLNVIAEYPAFGDAFESANRAAEALGVGRFDGLPHGKQHWYTSTSGLLGPVSAELVPRLRIATIAVEPDVEAGEVVVRWRLGGMAPGSSPTVELSLTAPNGRVIAERSIGGHEGRSVLRVERPERWGLWEPALYRLEARLRAGGRRDVPDQASVRFGLRSIAVRDGSVLLNGRPIYLRGALDQDFWPAGRSNPPSRVAIESQVALVHEMGLNLVRCHIKVPSEMYLDVADEAGLPVWGELPSWSRFGESAGDRARRMLGGMVDALGHHPSIVAWTVINEDWGTHLRHSARDRRWLRDTVDWLKERDRSRLVIDNSACETADDPNFHLRTDLADFHAYRSTPDGLPRWRAVVRDLASRPSWLWSPFGDASPTGDEPIVLSEFGGWGLPRPSAVRDSGGAEPWWWSTGQAFRRPLGLEDRFRTQGLDRIWPDVDALADVTQWQQFEGLASQIRELRRHGSIQGYVVTELSDAFWEANGLLDVGRGPKVFHHRLAEINAGDALVVDLPRTDLWAGERLTCAVILAAHPDAGSRTTGAGRIEWQVRLADGRATSGWASIDDWPDWDARQVAEVEIVVPDSASIQEAELIATATGSAHCRRAVHRQRCIVVPRPARPAARRDAVGRRVGIVDRVGLRSLASRLGNLGHDVVGVDDAELLVASEADRTLVEAANGGRELLVLARSTEAVTGAPGLALPAVIEPRRPGDVDPGRRPWDGDWSSVFAWALAGVAPGLPDGGLLHEAHAEVFPDHVISGLDVADPHAGVRAGLFSGWVHNPAAMLATFEQGLGRVTLTTLRLEPEHGPVATAFLDSIVRSAAAGSRR